MLFLLHVKIIMWVVEVKLVAGSNSEGVLGTVFQLVLAEGNESFVILGQSVVGLLQLLFFLN